MTAGRQSLLVDHKTTLDQERRREKEREKRQREQRVQRGRGEGRESKRSYVRTNVRESKSTRPHTSYREGKTGVRERAATLPPSVFFLQVCCGLSTLLILLHLIPSRPFSPVLLLQSSLSPSLQPVTVPHE